MSGPATETFLSECRFVSWSEWKIVFPSVCPVLTDRGGRSPALSSVRCSAQKKALYMCFSQTPLPVSVLQWLIRTAQMWQMMQKVMLIRSFWSKCSQWV